MSFSAVVRRLLISSPGDIPDGDLATVSRTISRWNGLYGEQFGAAVLPISWGEHAAAQFGHPPQAIINEQLVDRCDGCIAIFANRLGTATTVAESGTAEEIERLAAQGKYVAVLRCVRQVAPGGIDTAQLARLNAYLDKIAQTALILPYATDNDLSRHVDSILMNAVSRDQERAQLGLTTVTDTRSHNAEIWPRVEINESKDFGQGRLQREWILIVQNAGGAPARNVRFRLDQDWDVIGRVPGDSDIPVLAPYAEARYFINVTYGIKPQALCTVTWEDDRGPQENAASLRLI